MKAALAASSSLGTQQMADPFERIATNPGRSGWPKALRFVLRARQEISFAAFQKQRLSTRFQIIPKSLNFSRSFLIEAMYSDRQVPFVLDLRDFNCTLSSRKGVQADFGAHYRHAPRSLSTSARTSRRSRP